MKPILPNFPRFLRAFILPSALLFCSTPVRADPADDAAEARRRGVPIQQVQLEHAQLLLAKLQDQAKDLESQKQSQTAQYQSQIADLQKQLAKARADQSSRTPPPSAAPLSPSAAASNHRLEAGMPLPAAMVAFRTPPPPKQATTYVHSGFKSSSDAQGPLFTWSWGMATVNAGTITPTGPTFELAHAHVVEGKITDFHIDADQIDQWQAKITAANAAAAPGSP